MIAGLPITESNLICVLGRMRPARPHHRPRIRKKWLKRFGWKSDECPGVGYAMGYPQQQYVCCPHYMKKIAALTKEGTGI